MPKRVPKYVPKQTRISVQDVKSVGGMENEEMRRIALNVNAMRDEISALSKPKDTPAVVTPPVQSTTVGGGTTSPAAALRLMVLENHILKVDNTKILDFTNSATIGFSVIESAANVAKISAYTIGGDAYPSVYSNSTLAVPTAKKFNFVNGTNTTVVVNNPTANEAEIQVNTPKSIGKVLHLAFDYTSASYVSNTVIPTYGTVIWVFISINNAFDGVDNDMEVRLNGSTPLTLVAGGLINMYVSGSQYDISPLVYVPTAAESGNIEISLTLGGATTGDGEFWAFYADKCED